MIAIGGAIGTGLFLGGNRFGPRRDRLCDPRHLRVHRGARARRARALPPIVRRNYAREFFGEKGAYTVGWLYFLDWAATLVADITTVECWISEGMD